MKNKLKNLLKIAIYPLCLILIISTSTGCTSEGRPQDEGPVDTGVILGLHKNFPQIPGDLLSEHLYDSAYSDGGVVVCIDDGKPCLDYTKRFESIQKAINEQKRVQVANQRAQELLNEICKLKASSPEVDLLAAIAITSKEVLSMNSPNKCIVIIDSGISTTGVISFTNPAIFRADEKDITNQLVSKDCLPDLTGIHIYWVGIGLSCGSQEALSPTQMKKVQSIWQEIITRSGGTVEFSTRQLNTNQEVSSSYTVSTIKSENVELDLNTSDYVKLDEEMIGFKPNQTSFVDPEKARKTLEPIASYLKGNSETIYVVGMTASAGSINGSRKLSLKRAQVCMDILLQQGIPQSQLIAKGLGHTSCSIRVNDLDSGGNLIEEHARKNRAVLFIKANSKLGQEVKSL